MVIRIPSYLPYSFRYFCLAINYHLVMKKHILANLTILLYPITQLFILGSLLKNCNIFSMALITEPMCRFCSIHL